jgi:hypothetical protein
VLPPRLLERGDLEPLRIDPRLIDPRNESCVTVGVLGTPKTTFVLRFVPTGDGPPPEDEWPESSIAGAAQVTRCGRGKLSLTRLALEMRSPRGVLQTVTGESSGPLPSVRRVLPHRDPGPLQAPPGMGPRPTSVPLKRRAAAIEARASREGAAETAQKLLTANAEGTGAHIARLEPGCYRFDVLSPAASERGPAAAVDLDVEVALANGDVLASDATESADASGRFCLGQAELVRLRYVGSLPAVPVLLLMSRWALPSGIPPHWPAEARASIAQAIRRHHALPLGNALTYESLGVAGTTILPVEVEPGACYLIAAASVRGRSAGVALAVTHGDAVSQNHGGAEGDGTTLAFCALSETRAQVEVDARGAGLVWLLGIWQTGRMRIGEVQQ